MNLEESERTWLLDHLASLLHARGLASFLAMPIVEPTPRFFPDPWEPSARGLWWVALRLLGYAGLDQYEVDIVLDSDPRISELEESQGLGYSRRIKGVAAWFAGIVDSTCFFGFDPIHLKDLTAVVGVLAHETSHAYREHHGIADPDRDLDELLTDLTSVYLGFGILTTNASYRYRSGGWTEGAWTYTEYSHSQAGYLPPEAMVYLLAVQVALRDSGGALAKGISRHLETNQASMFREALSELESDELIQPLKLPARSLWPAPVEVRLASLPGPPTSIPELESDAAAREEPTCGSEPVFRVRRDSSIPFAVGGFLVLGLPILVVALVRSWGLGIAFAGPWAPFLLGFLIGRRRGYFVCSDEACKSRIPETVPACPGCHGPVLGIIRHVNDRLAEEERLSANNRDRT